MIDYIRAIESATRAGLKAWRSQFRRMRTIQANRKALPDFPEAN